MLSRIVEFFFEYSGQLHLPRISIPGSIAWSLKILYIYLLPSALGILSGISAGTITKSTLIKLKL